MLLRQVIYHIAAVAGAVALTSGVPTGDASVLLSDVQCQGVESMLVLCPANRNPVSCTRNNPAGVRCGKSIRNSILVQNMISNVLLTSSTQSDMCGGFC